MKMVTAGMTGSLVTWASCMFTLATSSDKASGLTSMSLVLVAFVAAYLAVAVKNYRRVKRF